MDIITILLFIAIIIGFLAVLPLLVELALILILLALGVLTLAGCGLVIVIDMLWSSVKDLFTKRAAKATA